MVVVVFPRLRLLLLLPPLLRGAPGLLLPVLAPLVRVPPPPGCCCDAWVELWVEENWVGCGGRRTTNFRRRGSGWLYDEEDASLKLLLLLL